MNKKKITVSYSDYRKILKNRLKEPPSIGEYVYLVIFDNYSTQSAMTLRFSKKLKVDYVTRVLSTDTIKVSFRNYYNIHNPLRFRKSDNFISHQSNNGDLLGKTSVMLFRDEDQLLQQLTKGKYYNNGLFSK